MEENKIQTELKLEKASLVNSVNPRTKWLKFGAVSVLGILLLFVAFVLGRQTAVAPETTDISPTPTQVTDDETANWKTFEYSSFSIKAPSDWIRNSGPGSSDNSNFAQISNYDISKGPGREFEPELDKGLLKVEISKVIPEETDLEGFVSSQVFGTDSKTDRIKVNNQNAILLKSSKSGSAVYIKNPFDSRIYFISFLLDFGNYESLRDQILSTFKFTDQKNLSNYQDFLTELKNAVIKADENVLLSLQRKVDTTCDSENAFNPSLCEGVPDGQKRQGYLVGRDQSEGSIYSEQEILAEISRYLNQHGPFKYYSEKSSNNKAAVSFKGLETEQGIGNILVLYADNELGSWKTVLFLEGIGTSRYSTLDNINLDFNY